MESILNYEIYAYKQTATLTTSDWKKVLNNNKISFLQLFILDWCCRFNAFTYGSYT